MIETDDGVFFALQELGGIARTSQPLVFWVGAGASAWCKYKLWGELASRLHQEFVRTEPAYDRDCGARLIQDRLYPRFFSLARATRVERYVALLKSEFAPRPATPEYERFLRALGRFSPLRIVTTNFDECLERQLPHCTLIQRADIAQALDILKTADSFILKLHGSISAVETVVLTEEDYERLSTDERYLQLLERLFAQASLVCVGTSASEEYLLNLLRTNSRIKGAFGDGPHFLVSGTIPDNLPSSFRAIRYRASSAVGHRSAIKVLESVAPEEKRSDSRTEPSLNSAYFLIDLFPPGVPWQTSLTTTLANSKTMVRGLGFTNDELPAAPTTLHDVLVGLACFEKLYAPIETIGKLFFALGDTLVAELIRADALDFVWWDAEESISFESKDAVVGGLNSFIINNPKNEPLSLQEKLATFIGFRRDAAEPQKRELLKLIAKATIRVREGFNSPICETIESLVSLPQVRHMLGFGGYTQPRRVPRWLAHPVLRVARLTRAAETCRFLGAASIKFPFGAATLANALFATEPGKESAAAATNYILYGSFSPAVPSSRESYRELVSGLLRFRETNEAALGRKAVMRCLSRREGADCVAAIDAALTRSIPTSVMQECRDQFSRFLLSENPLLQFAPGVWAEDASGNLSRWRAQARRSLLDHCKNNDIKMSASCPCGSTVTVEKCCLPPLNDES